MLGTDPSKAAYRRWYEKNKDDFNAKRRDRYKNDEGYRKKALDSTHSYRAEGPRHPEKVEHQMYREVEGELIEVFRISTVAGMIGRSVQAIRQWEKAGIIPKPIFGRGHRVYTRHQVALMHRVVAVSDRYRHKRAIYARKIATLKIKIEAEW